MLSACKSRVEYNLSMNFTNHFFFFFFFLARHGSQHVGGPVQFAKAMLSGRCLSLMPATSLMNLTMLAM